MVISTSRGGASLPATGGYSWAAGTSMAAPAVAGVAALIKERCPNAGPADLENLLADSADDEGKPGNDPFYGKGFANALRAVTEGSCPGE